MAGINVGATKITHSNGKTLAVLSDETPRDLLKRVAEGTPYVWLDEEHRCELRAAHDIYAEAIADALRDQHLGSFDEAPVALAVPGWWTQQALTRVRIALEKQGVNVRLANDAEAAVTEYLHQGHTLPENTAVVSLRAGYASVVIVRNCLEEPRALLTPALVHDEGGDYLNTAVLQHLVRGLVDLGEGIKIDDPHVISAARDALSQCRTVREALSTSSSESLLTNLPGTSHRIRLVRSELEELAEPWADSIMRMVSTAIDQAALPLEAVLLTGGLATMPLISQRISADLALEVYVPQAPAQAAARGAQKMIAAQQMKPTRWGLGFWRSRKPRARHIAHPSQRDELTVKSRSADNPQFETALPTSTPAYSGAIKDRSVQPTSAPARAHIESLVS